MIISRRHKYIFIGIPFSGSTAISKELCLLYDGEPILTKHANIQMLQGDDIELSSYTVAAVLRNPVESIETYFYKLKYPPDGYYEDPAYNLENGGHIRRRDRKRHAVVKAQDMNFSQFVNRFYRLPYDTFFSLNKPYLDHVIHFSDLNNSFKAFLARCGIEAQRDLPVVNKSATKPGDQMAGNSVPLSFRTFLYENRDLLQVNIARPNFLYYQLYQALKPLRFAHWLRVDRKRPVEEYGTYYELVNRSTRDSEA